jgi:hypothetical protein
LIVVVLLVLTLIKVSGTEKAGNEMVSRIKVTEMELANLLQVQHYNQEFEFSRNYEIWTAIHNI